LGMVACSFWEIGRINEAEYVVSTLFLQKVLDCRGLIVLQYGELRNDCIFGQLFEII
jgi:hypothetical protein